MRSITKEAAMIPRGYNLITNPSFGIKPCTLDFVLYHMTSPPEYTSTAFLVGVTDDGKVVLANNQRRGLEISGGHVEPGERLAETASREFLEETGGRTIGKIIPVGFERIISAGVAPEGYKYPFPVGFQQFFVSRVEMTDDFVENDECAKPSIMKIEDALASQVLPSSRRFIIDHAYKLIK